ncbi:MAG: hypothetical protein WBZ36_26520 [Candidatus Nitrosopolaris sp.]
MANNRKQRQNKLVLALRNKNAYPHEVHLPKIKIYETHVSWIFLTGLYAYKIKKGVKFGNILDFSTLYLRRKYCRKEIQINKVLCADMYKGIVKLVSRNNGSIKIADLQTKGKPIEYGVKMLEIPQKFRMDYLIRVDKVSLKTIDRLTRIFVNFHSSTRTNSRIKSFGMPTLIKKKIDENFQTFRKLNSEMAAYKLDKIYKIYKRLITFLTNNKTLFYQRIRQSKIREIHGDLYLANIFVVNDERFYLYDRIEFNDLLRYADVTEDVAHLSMDLDYHGRIDLRKHFVSQYIKRSDDFDLRNLLYFLMCYKACVRAKVSLFRAKTKQTTKQEKAGSKNLKIF